MKKTKKNSNKIVVPPNLLVPIAKFFKSELKALASRRKDVESEDPFSNRDRTTDNAAIDTEAEEQFGHATAVAIKEQIDRKMIQTRRALTRVKLGSYAVCSSCGNMINTDRLMIYPEATLCVKCEKKKEKKR